jgi:hypothetical protein
VKILLDEGVPDLIEKRLRQFSITTVQGMGWRGVRNGALLDLMVGQFAVLITTDKNIPFQQNLMSRKISAIVLPANDIPSVIQLLPVIESALQTISPGEVIQL